MSSFNSVYRTGPVTALSFISSSVLAAGIASDVHLYDVHSGDSLAHFEALPYALIHGLQKEPTDSNFAEDKLHVCAFGQKSARVVQIDYNETFKITSLNTASCFEDWIWAVCWIRPSSDCQESTIALALGHNVVLHWDWHANVVLQNISCVEKCILYSAHFIGHEWSSLVLAAGTVFNQVVLWSPSSKECNETGHVKVLHRLEGHEGVIFAVDYFYRTRKLCSVSDDRSIRLWQVHSCQETNVCQLSVSAWEDVRFELLHVLYGHAARVWSVNLLTTGLVSIGEDATCCVWDYDGNVMQKFKGHKGKSIWSMDVSSCESMVATGGGDTSIRLWNLSKDKNPVTQFSCRLLKPALRQGEHPRSVALCEHDRVFIMTNFGHLLVHNVDMSARQRVQDVDVSAGQSVQDVGVSAGQSVQDVSVLAWQSVQDDLEYSSYSTLSVSANGQFVILGNIKGRIRLLTLNTDHNAWHSVDRQVYYADHNAWHSVDRQVYSGKVLSIVWLCTEKLITSGPEGEMHIWHITASIANQSSLQLSIQLLLPCCKQRWCTAAAIVAEAGLLVCGDRGGTVHVYQYTMASPEGSETEVHTPICSFPQIHGKAGVTGVYYYGNHVYTCGRDGYYRYFSIEDGSLRLLHACKAYKGMDWIDHLLFHCDDMWIVGFISSSLVIWSSNHNQRLLEVECGGGHRSWDYHLSSENAARVVYVKSGDVVLCDAALQDNMLLVKPNLHGRELTDVKHLISFSVSGSHTPVIHLCCLTSEDNNISIAALTYNETTSRCQVSILKTIQGHISSVRCLSVVPGSCLSSQAHSDYKDIIMLSGGGRAQIKIWKLRILFNKLINCEEVSHQTSTSPVFNSGDTDRCKCTCLHSELCKTHLNLTHMSRVQDLDTIFNKESNIETDFNVPSKKETQNQQNDSHGSSVSSKKTSTKDQTSHINTQQCFKSMSVMGEHNPLSPDINNALPQLTHELLTSYTLGQKRRTAHKPWKSSGYDSNPETRIMDMTSFPASWSIRDAPADYLVFAVACSDAYLRCFLHDPIRKAVHFICQSSFHDRCILRVGHFRHLSSATMETNVFLYSAGTDGRVAFWKLSAAVERLLSNIFNKHGLSKSLIANARTVQSTRPSCAVSRDNGAAQIDVYLKPERECVNKPICDDKQGLKVSCDKLSDDLNYDATSFTFIGEECRDEMACKADIGNTHGKNAGQSEVHAAHADNAWQPSLVITCHQSGVNSMDIKCIAVDVYLLVSGGDDNALNVCLLKMMNKEENLQLIQQQAIRDAHAAQITGIRIVGNSYIVTVSIDQRLCLWRIQSMDSLQVNMVSCKFIHVADVSSMDVWKTNDQGSSYTVMVCGEGLEVLSIDIPQSDEHKGTLETLFLK